MNNYKNHQYEPPSNYYNNQGNYYNYQYSNQTPNQYVPPIMLPKTYEKADTLPTIEMLNLNSNRDRTPGKDNNDYQKITNKIYHLDNHLNSLGSYSTVLWIMLIWSCFCLFSSMLFIASYNPRYDIEENPVFEKFNFLVNLIFIFGYIFGIQAFTKQCAEKTQQFSFVLIGFIVCNIFYFFVFMALYIGFFRYLGNILFVVINSVLYYQNQEIIKLFAEKTELRRRLELSFF